MNPEIKDIVSVIGTLFAIAMSLLAVIRSNKQKQSDDIAKALRAQTEMIEKANNQITKVNDILQAHIVNDASEIATLRANTANITVMLSHYLNTNLGRKTHDDD